MTPFMRYQGMTTAETLAVDIFTIISLINHNATTFAPDKNERLSTQNNSHSDTYCNANGDYVSLYDINNSYFNIMYISKYYAISSEINKNNFYNSDEYSSISSNIQCHANSFNDPVPSKIQYCPPTPLPSLIYHL